MAGLSFWQRVFIASLKGSGYSKKTLKKIVTLHKDKKWRCFKRRAGYEFGFLLLGVFNVRGENL